jgi:dTDP-4-dehydrorhamnose 3,5-epimerase
MRFIDTELPGLIIIEPDVFEDRRGHFLETYHAKKYADAGIPGPFVQDNFSRSLKGTVRGLHYQRKNGQGKIVYVTDGSVFDVAVDLRSGSPTFGRWVGMDLSGENRRQLYVPPGFAHGFCVTTESAGFAYKCTEFYDPQDEAGVIWNDPTLAIAWPVLDPLLSPKDLQLKPLADISSTMLPVYRR